jgi:hypothetical protein
MSRKAHFLYWAVIVALLLEIAKQRRETLSLNDKLREAVIAEGSERSAVQKQEKELLSLQNVVSQLRPAPSDEAFENALELWIAKVHRLSAYLDAHPNLRIPQMDVLTANNWLDVTKDNNLVSDADFRADLGRLRGLARLAFAPEIGKALGQALAANGGQLPTNPQELAQYFPSGADPTILGQLQINPSGSIPGIASKQQFVLVDAPVDLWDTTMFYNTNGGFGSRSMGQGAQDTVANAIAQYTHENGTVPTDVSQLTTYQGINSMSPSDLSAIFQALTTKPP